MAGVNPGASWQPPPRHSIAIREWDDEFVVYNGATGDTHHLATLAGDVLLTLLDHPDGIALRTLVDTTARRIAVPDGVSLDAEIDGVLARLAQLRLAFPIAA
jgi:PqqD family protein of HPr-rel-A system